MVEKILDKSSHSLVRTNPKLTTNVKVVSNGSDIFLESFSANSQLASSRFKSFKVNPNSTYDKDIYRFYQEGKFPKELAFEVFQKYEDLSVLNSYDSQYEMFYSAGAESISSESYPEDLGILAPLWLNEQIPNYFVIFRLDNPAAINNLNSTDPNANEFSAQTSIDFEKFVLENCTAIKTFDLTENSNLGKYIRNYRFQQNFPIAPLTTSWRSDEPILWNGISYRNGGFTSVGEYSYEDLITRDNTIIQNEYFFTKGFERNGVILANLLNLQFLFSDNNADEYSLNRYFGLYVNEVEEGSFDLSGEGFYKGTEKSQTPKITSITKVSDQLNEPFEIQNPNGVLLYIDDTTVETVTGIPTQQRVNEVESIFYVKDKNDQFHTIKKGSKWGTNQIRLFDKKIDISTLTGYKRPDTFANAQIINKRSSAVCTFKVLDQMPDGVSIKFYDGLNYTGEVAASSSLAVTPGTSFQAFFNPSGTVEEIAKSISLAINGGINRSNRFFEASYSGDTVYVKSLFTGSRFNRLRFEINWDEYPDANLQSYPETNESIQSTNFVGGNDVIGGLLKVEKGDEDRFRIGNFVKTKGGYAKILTYVPYLEEPIKSASEAIIGYTGINDYVLIVIDESDVLLTGSSQAALYSDFKPSFGRFSFFPIRDFDFDFYSEDYSDLGELSYESSYYNRTNGTQYIGTGTNPDIRRFYDDGGFANLIGLLRDADPDVTFDNVILSEYDRLEENYLKSQAIASRVIPYINKWGYYKEGKNVRNLPYRLSLSEAFTLYNFAPGKRAQSQSPDAFSHEWYYLSKIPTYFGTDAIEESWSYFNDIPVDSIPADPNSGTPHIPGTFQNVSRNYFDEYFIADKFTKDSDITLIDRQIRYGRFFGGNSQNFSQAFLRGVKIIAKKKALNSNKANFNAKKLAYVRDGSFNDYKFSAMMVVNSPDKPKTEIKFIKNEKWKTVTMLIFLSLSDTCINGGENYIDRTSLYSLNNRYGYDNSCEVIQQTGTEYQYENGVMSGAISFISSGQYIVDPSQTLVRGQIDNNGNPTRFLSEIRIGLDGKYMPIQFEIDGDTYRIDGISKVLTDDQLICNNITKNGVPLSLPQFIPTNLNLRDATYTIIGSGFGEYVNLLNEVSFAKIFQNVNQGSPNVIYETVDANGNTILLQNGNLAQTFTIELVAQDDILKSVYIGVLPDQNKPTVFNLVDIIGYDLSLQRRPRITPIARHSGYYEPISKDITFFRDPYLNIDFDQPTTGGTGATGGGFIPDELYKLRVLEYTRYANTQFYSQDPRFGQIKRLFYHKVNQEDPSSILELSSDSPFLSLYPLINEVGIDYRDFYIFSSNWEPGYFRKSIDKSQVISVPGTRSMLEKKSFFGSKYLKIPQQITLETFTPSEFNQEAVLQSDLVDGTFMHNETRSTVELYLFIQKRLIDELFEPIKETFIKYLNPLFSFGEEDTLDDDVRRYITQNVLKLYKINSIDLYVRSTRSREGNVYTTAELSNSDKINQGLVVNGNFSSRLLNSNAFDSRLIYNKKGGFSEAFGFSVTLIKK